MIREITALHEALIACQIYAKASVHCRFCTYLTLIYYNEVVRSAQKRNFSLFETDVKRH